MLAVVGSGLLVGALTRVFNIPVVGDDPASNSGSDR